MLPRVWTPHTNNSRGRKRLHRDWKDRGCHAELRVCPTSRKHMCLQQPTVLCLEGHPRSPTWRVSTAEHSPKSGVMSSHIGTKTSCSKKSSFMVSINRLSKSCPDVHFRAQSPCFFILTCKVSALLQYSLPNKSCQNTFK